MISLDHLFAEKHHLPHGIRQVLPVAQGNIKYYRALKCLPHRRWYVLQLVLWRLDRVLLEPNSEHGGR